MLHDHPHDELDYSKPVLTRWIGDGIGLQAPVSHSTVTSDHHSHRTVTAHITVISHREGGSGITSDCKHQSAPDKHQSAPNKHGHLSRRLPGAASWGLFCDHFLFPFPFVNPGPNGYRTCRLFSWLVCWGCWHKARVSSLPRRTRCRRLPRGPGHQGPISCSSSWTTSASVASGRTTRSKAPPTP